MNVRYRTIAAVFVPILLMVAWWVRIAQVTGAGRTVQFAVSGYDPRDLLSGHYLTYQVRYAPSDPCSRDGHDDQCACFSDNGSQVTWSGECRSRPTDRCKHFLRGTCDGNRFIAGIERFYFPERFSTSLAAIPRDAAISVSIGRDGNGIVTSFTVAGEPLLDWVKRQSTPTMP